MRTASRLVELRRLLLWLALGFAAQLLAGCGTTIVATPSAYGPLISPPTVIPTLPLTRQVIFLTVVPASEAATPSPSPEETPTLSNAEMGATKVAMIEEDVQRSAAIATQWAQGTRFVVTPMVIPTSEPMDTPVPGIVSCGGADHIYSFASCWSRRLDDAYLFVQSGIRKPAPKDTPDPPQGLLLVDTSTLDQKDWGPVEIYNAPTGTGSISIASVDWPHMTLVTARSRSAISTFAFNLQTRHWEQPEQCKLYPVALHQDSLTGDTVEANFVTRTVGYGTSTPDFGWLTWNGDTTNDTLAHSLVLPGDSDTYTNPDNPSDHTVSVGDWMLGRPEVTNGPDVEQAFADLAGRYFIVPVPVWDQAVGQGTHWRYHVSGFAWIYGIPDYHVGEPPNSITFRYWGPASCPANP